MKKEDKRKGKNVFHPPDRYPPPTRQQPSTIDSIKYRDIPPPTYVEVFGNSGDTDSTSHQPASFIDENEEDIIKILKTKNFPH